MLVMMLMILMMMLDDAGAEILPTNYGVEVAVVVAQDYGGTAWHMR